MLTILENVLFSKDLINIMKNYNSQTASELFKGYNGIPTNTIDNNYAFHVIARSKDELRIILSFFTKFSLIDFQTIRLKTMDMSFDDIKNVIEEFNGTNTIEMLIFDVSYDKSCDFIDYTIYNFIKQEVNEIKNSIPKDASTLEIITYVYNTLKKREYKYDKKHPEFAKLYSLSLVSGDTVCAGFSKIFNNILAEYGIEASEYIYHYEGGIYDHDISIVNVKDDKYGVNGLYFFDLTKDCYSPLNRNDYKYSGFMMTFDEIAKQNITSDCFNRMLLFNSNNLKETVDILKPEINKLTIDDDIIDEDKINRHEKLILTLMRVHNDLFKNLPIDLFYLDNDYGALYFIYSYMLFLKNNLGEKVNEITIIDLLINTVGRNDPGYYLASAISYLENNNSNTFIPDDHFEYIKKKLNNK